MFQIFCDFDGTITRQDSLKLLFEHFVPEDWPEIEKQMCSKEISEPEAFRRVLAKLSIGLDEAISWLLERIEFDPTFKSFLKWCEFRDLSFKILSGGLHPIIHALLEREGLTGLPIEANRVHFSDDIWQFFPATKPGLGCKSFSHCKCLSMHESTQTFVRSVYIGDGWTDRCPVKRADLVFAKSSLRTFCREEGVFFVPFESFSEIQFCLEEFFRNDIRNPRLANQSSALSSHLP